MFRHLRGRVRLSLVSPPFFELLFRLLVFMTSLDSFLKLAASRELPCRFCSFFAHSKDRRRDKRKRNFEVIGDRPTRFHPRHRRQLPGRAPISTTSRTRTMASRVLRLHCLLDSIVSRTSQQLRRNRSTRGVHSEAVDSAFASQLDAVNVLATSPGQGTNPDDTSLYSLFVYLARPMTVLTPVTGNGVAIKRLAPQLVKTDRP